MTDTTDPQTADAEPADLPSALIELRHARAEVERLRPFVDMADQAQRDTEAAAPPAADRGAVLREAAEALDGLTQHPDMTMPEGRWRAGLDAGIRELHRLADEERDEQEAQAHLDQLAEDVCRPVDIGGEAVRVHGAAEMSDEARAALAEVTAIVKRRMAAGERDEQQAQQGECAASTSGNCLREAQSETACDTEAGECVHGGRPAACTCASAGDAFVPAGHYADCPSPEARQQHGAAAPAAGQSPADTGEEAGRG